MIEIRRYKRQDDRIPLAFGQRQPHLENPLGGAESRGNAAIGRSGRPGAYLTAGLPATAKPMTDEPLPETPESASQEIAAENQRKARTKAAIWPTFRAAYASFLYAKGTPEGLVLEEITRDLQERNDEVWDGDLKQLEAMLNAQAHSLGAMFHALAERAALNLGKHLETTETYLKLAFRAQSQCARTLEALAGIKSPPMVIARQANIAQGHQQVNNVRASETLQNPPNKLLEQTHGERLDLGATAAAGGTHPAMAPLGAKHGTENSGGKRRSGKERLQGRRAVHAEAD